MKSHTEVVAKRGGPAIAVMVVISLLLLLPSVASAEPSSEVPGELQLKPDAFVHFTDGQMALGRSSRTADRGEVSPASLQVADVDEQLAFWTSMDGVLFNLALGLGAPLYFGLEPDSMLGAMMTGEHGRENMDRSLDFYARTPEHELDLARVIDNRTPADPVMVQFLSITF